MSNILDVREVHAGEWSALVREFGDHNYEQSAVYAQEMARRSHMMLRFVAVYQGGEPLGCAAVRIKRIPALGGVGYISGGPLCRHDHPRMSLHEAQGAVFSALYAHLVEREGLVLLARAPVGFGAEGEACVSAARAAGFAASDQVRKYQTVLIDLAQDEAKLRANLHSKWRNRLNQSEKAGLEVEIGSSRELWVRFRAVYDAMNTFKSFESEVDPSFFDELDFENLGFVFLIATQNGVDVGGVVLSILGDTAVDLFAAADCGGRDTRSGYYLRWRAMKYLKERCVLRYDMGGVDKDHNFGGYEFKTRMGGELVHAAGPFKASDARITSSLVEFALTLRNKRKRSEEQQHAPGPHHAATASNAPADSHRDGVKSKASLRSLLVWLGLG